MSYRTRTPEEHIILTAKAMLLGYEYDPHCTWFRERLGPSFQGCAWFQYRDVDDLRIVVEKRSELDRPLKQAYEDASTYAK